ncbi:hypothetical protein IWW38_001267 [Coemansia aciculifera]|uniref:Uncharacterized protein n=1 Tax=Coemansia aciculifera TaxID=417176 RepID=A0ACC1M8S5_9FUNG|nr:hypothetical protein IWW38_001267 [Coemansia aciculifera]
MSGYDGSAFLAAVSLLPRETYPATHGLNAAFGKADEPIRKRLAPHLHPLLIKLRVFCVRQTLLLEERLHMNPMFKLLLSTRIIPPSLAFIAAAATTVYALRFLYKHSLDLLTNIIGVAYPAYQSILAIEYGDCKEESLAGAADEGSSRFRIGSALGIEEPSLDKKQWLMYWAIYGVLTTADHWAGSILRLFPMYRFAKIGVLVWAQHRKYNGAAWLYDTFVRPLLPPPPPPSQKPQATAFIRHGAKCVAGEDIHPSAFSLSAMPVASVWDATTPIDSNVLPPTRT